MDQKALARNSAGGPQSEWWPFGMRARGFSNEAKVLLVLLHVQRNASAQIVGMCNKTLEKYAPPQRDRQEDTHNNNNNNIPHREDINPQIRQTVKHGTFRHSQSAITVVIIARYASSSSPATTLFNLPTIRNRMWIMWTGRTLETLYLPFHEIPVNYSDYPVRIWVWPGFFPSSAGIEDNIQDLYRADRPPYEERHCYEG